MPDTSNCLQHFGYDDFLDDFANGKRARLCPVRGCSTKPVDIPYRKTQRPFCPTHGLRLHANTFVYWNGNERKDDARLRNFQMRPELAREIALPSVGKAETHRLGYEMSEDALSWNVFVGLAQAQKLRRAVKFLTDRALDVEPKLYMWGKLVNVDGSDAKGTPYRPLYDARRDLEPDIIKFWTEPDVMLVVEGKVVICIEAKFGSGNTLAHEGEVQAGHKPTDRAGLLRRYLDTAPPETRRLINRENIGTTFHSQLFRNIIFASTMANGVDFHVVNLVSATQWRRGKESKSCSFFNPEESIQSYLCHDRRECFTFRTWEDLHKSAVKGDAELNQLDAYLSTKSAHYRRAFDLD